MSILPSSLKQIAYFLQRLPGIGEKTANRLAFYMLRLPETDLKEFAQNIKELKNKTKFCSRCNNLTEETLCNICSNDNRDQNKIMVVEDVLDLISFETGRIYDGLFHLLHGRIDPLNNIGPQDIYLDSLFKRVVEEKIKEVILATNLDTEGEATAMFIKNKLDELKKRRKLKFKITRLAFGLPMGANLEYADYMTLQKSIEGRSNY
ncbi:recombination protein RecR [Candidatus Roizmanbacteria bacterium RIFCSPHIGHO2_12_FULL_33_9]|uniref:Recombination protein RecR n=1 Tax=Candidatus Roizmanbacteria bacterium RIFCSPHIGHO2_12_FULL_33_9 TaxID=1802045 RepID=A0A1F7HIQ4_9BACT|nr:MAG: recombination protein RecR [Candidatus Roizmanbacteria bacterium RIFCSPHIGHO2_12_FULL_33_9]